MNSIKTILIFLFILFGNLVFSQAKFEIADDVFGTRVFIKNNGQFDEAIPNHAKIDYAYLNADEQVYFSKNGLTYVLQKFPKYTERDLEEMEDNKNYVPKAIKKCFVNVSWEQSNSDVEIIESEMQSFYHSFGDEKYKSECYKKITYKNIYNNIDIEYVFTAEKKYGIKYNVILHPGAHINDVKIKFSGN